MTQSLQHVNLSGTGAETLQQVISLIFIADACIQREL